MTAREIAELFQALADGKRLEWLDSEAQFDADSGRLLSVLYNGRAVRIEPPKPREWWLCPLCNYVTSGVECPRCNHKQVKMVHVREVEA